MRFSIWPDPSMAPAEVLDLARWADGAGWFGFWYADHYMPNTGTDEIEHGDTHECWAILPAVAAVTEHLRIGPLVSPTSVHHPAVLANRATTIDHLSNGRMVLGLGAGWQINEHHAYGIELEPPGRRVDRFAEALQIVRSLLADEVTEFSGDHYRMTGAVADPKPIQRPLPLLVGTGSPRMLRITARFADEWNTWGAPALARPRRQLFEAACSAVGRDPESMHTSVQALVEVTDDAAVSGAAGDRTIAGNAEQVGAQIDELEALGFDEFNLPMFSFGESPAERLERVVEFHETVVAPRSR